MTDAPDLAAVLSRLVRADRGRLIAALIASLDDFDLAEDAFSDAVESALVHWRRTGVPDNPQGWLLRVARRKAIDRIRRQGRFRARRPELERLAQEDEAAANAEPPDIPDERLRLIFTCCHPALAPKSRVALTLRTLCGVSTGDVARAFLDKEATMGQRLSRARAKIARAGIPFAVPGPDQWDARLASVLAVIYLVFNQGHVARSGAEPLRAALCEEAIRLAAMLNDLRPDEPEVLGLLSLLLTTHARRSARLSPEGATVALDRQDRALWDGPMIARGLAHLDRALALGQPGPYQIKAAISALHAGAPRADATDWRQIVLLYDALLGHEPTAVVRLNRAVAVARVGQAELALAEIERLGRDLGDYQPYHAARADLLAGLGRRDAARAAYGRAVALTGNDADRAFLQARRDRLDQEQDRSIPQAQKPGQMPGAKKSGRA